MVSIWLIKPMPTDRPAITLRIPIVSAIKIHSASGFLDSLAMTGTSPSLRESPGRQHHGELVSVVPPQPMRAQLSLRQEPVFEDLVTHPNVLHLFDAIGLCGLVDKNGSPIRGAHP